MSLKSDSPGGSPHIERQQRLSHGQAGAFIGCQRTSRTHQILIMSVCYIYLQTCSGQLLLKMNVKRQPVNQSIKHRWQ
jgi:hypothetical protein